MIIIINVKKTSFAGFQLPVFENKFTFMEKAVLHTTTLTHRKVRQILRDLFSTEQRNDSEMTFGEGATKISLKPQTFEYLAMTGSLDTRNNLTASIILGWKIRTFYNF